MILVSCKVQHISKTSIIEPTTYPASHTYYFSQSNEMSAIVKTRTFAAPHERLDNLSQVAKVISNRPLYTVDDLIHNRSQTIPDTVLVAYPGSPRGRSDYVYYTARDLDRFADHGANTYASIGLVPNVGVRPNKLKRY